MSEQALAFDFDGETKPEPRLDEPERSIERAYAAAPMDWRERALAIVHQLAYQCQFFTTDRVWDQIETPREPRALGGVMTRSVKNGWIRATRAFETSRRGERHKAPIRVWESRLCGQTRTTQQEKE